MVPYSINIVKLYGGEHVGFLTLLLSAIEALIRSNNAVLLKKLPRPLDMERSFLTSNVRHIKNGQQFTPVPSMIILSSFL